MRKIYNIGLKQKVTPLMVRDALVECFFEAHCEDTGVDKSEEDINKEYCKSIVKKAFKKVDGDFENPTKKDILHVVNELADFSKSFRNPKIIEKHAKEIMSLIKRMG